MKNSVKYFAELATVINSYNKINIIYLFVKNKNNCSPQINVFVRVIRYVYIF